MESVESAPRIGIGGMVPSLVINAFIPIVVYLLVRPHVGSDAEALLAAAVVPFLGELRSWRQQRHLDVLGVLVLAGLATGVIGTVALQGNPLLLKVRESLITGAIGVACLVSLILPRPLGFYFAKAFMSRGSAEQAARFDQLWQFPAARSSFRVITVLWGVGLVAEAAVRTQLALSLSTTRFLVVQPIVTYGFFGGLIAISIVWGQRSARRARALRAAAEQRDSPEPEAELRPTTGTPSLID